MPRRIQDAILWTYQVKSIKYSLAIARFVGILSLSSALYVDKGGIDVVLPSVPGASHRQGCLLEAPLDAER